MSSPERPGPTLRVGLFGGGRMAIHHVKAIQSTGRATIAGIADPAADRDALQAVLPGDAVILSGAEELLERLRPDVVHVVTPPHTHAELARLAIRAGCHVYVEKPFTETRSDASSVLALAAARGVQVCAGHQVLFEAPALAARTELTRIGRVVHLESYFSFRMVRRTITAVDQIRDILPHAVYPVVEQLRAATGLVDAPLQLAGLSVAPDGEVYALVRLGQVTAVLLVTLNGRPIEHYQHIVGTNGSLRLDYVTGSVTALVGQGTGPGVLLTPYRRAFRTAVGATKGFGRLVFGKTGSYPGLRVLVDRFYGAILDGADLPMGPRSILDTVELCEAIGQALADAERAHEQQARARLMEAELRLPSVDGSARLVLVTGGTGLLGRKVVDELRRSGCRVRALARSKPPYSRRVPGVEYVTADLSRGLDSDLLRGISVVVHCAAETAGGRGDQQRNSVDATRNVLQSAAAAGVRRVVVVSSLAVLKGSRETGRPLNENSPVDVGNLRRGPYVWGKAESEVLAERLGTELGLGVSVIRPGPLVDYSAFDPPGRLGREFGPWYVAIGPKNSPLSVCDVSTAARVIRGYVEDFDAAPRRLNLVESPPPRRRELADRLTALRPDLRVVWIPAWLLRALSAPLKLVQRLALGVAEPLDVAAAFASERYDTSLAAEVITRAGTRAPADPEPSLTAPGAPPTA